MRPPNPDVRFAQLDHFLNSFDVPHPVLDRRRWEKGSLDDARGKVDQAQNKMLEVSSYNILLFTIFVFRIECCREVCKSVSNLDERVICEQTFGKNGEPP